MTEPTVSVVIPCHNGMPWIAEAVQSALSQANVNLEVIVVDDGSTDGSGAAAQALDAARVTVVAGPQRGASHARNIGTGKVRGEFIQYLDADDVLLPGTVSNRVSRLEATAADVAYCDWVHWTEQVDGSFIEVDPWTHVLRDPIDVDLVQTAWWPPAALLYRRSVVDRIGLWREDLPIIQDARFLQDAAFVGGRFVHVPGTGARYRVAGAHSLSRRDRPAFLQDCFRNGQMIEALWIAQGPLTTERRRCLARLYSMVGIGLAETHRSLADEALGRVVAIDPTFQPESSPAIRALSRLVGYARAERAARVWRRTRARAAAAS